jgi:hypothetical protein
LITIAEPYAGVRDGAERQQLDGFVEAFSMLALTLKLKETTGLLRKQALLGKQEQGLELRSVMAFRRCGRRRRPPRRRH